MIVLSFENTRSFLRNFKEDDRGSMTVFGLFFFIVSGILGAIALDVTSLYAERTHLQIAADQAAHAALYNYAIKGESEADSIAAAIAVVQATLPAGQYGVTIDAANIEFGSYDPVLDVFVPGAGYGAARATTAYTDARGNSASAFLFRLIGIDDFEINTSAIFDTDKNPECLNDGFVAQGVVEMNNQNYFGEGFCVHSNAYVSIQPRNEFAGGSIVTMPDGKKGVNVSGLNTDGMTEAQIDEWFTEKEEQGQLIGLLDALDTNTIDLRVFDRVTNMIDMYLGRPLTHREISGDNVGYPDYIVGSNRLPQNIITITDTDYVVDTALMQPNRVYYIPDCDRNARRTGTLNIESGGDRPPLNNVIIITDCDVEFGQGSVVTNARVITTSLDANSIKAPSGVRLGNFVEGVDENGNAFTCETADSAQLVTPGGMHFAADFTAYGSQVFTGGTFSIAATPGSSRDFVGTSVISGGLIDIRSHVGAEVGCIDDDDENRITATYLRMVR